MTKYRRKFHRIARKLTNLELQQGSTDFSFSMEGVLDDLQQSRGTDFFMGFYSEEGILRAFEKFGICRELRKRGFENLQLIIDTRDNYRQLLRMYYDRKDDAHLLGEIVVEKARMVQKSERLIPERFYPLGMLVIDWLALQDPTAEFSDERPRLPGQDYPGLGIGAQILELLYLMAKHQQTHGLLIVPHYYHTALIFSREFRFLNPAYQALLNRMEEDLGEYPLPVRAWGVETGAVYRKYDNTVFKWEPEEQVLACHHGLRSYLHSEEYENRVADAESNYAFYLDTERLKSKLPGEIELQGDI
ncbi:MAG: hypothetical protein K9N46_17055 [Candidatus Marinimicrobia bacterium]|nr:hypothetical protein [Candidatus Neomarinimicrobiota bacterium]MCF7830296.1 hypothetical protein [Candidatus Neomarinimicrobiota bacterium]MCF7882437.1 hypothetical protein [Candidatus Neomarinimicrobiota bacterium]